MYSPKSGYVTIFSARKNTTSSPVDKEHLHESIKNDYANVQWNARVNSMWFNNPTQHEYSPINEKHKH